MTGPTGGPDLKLNLEAVSILAVAGNAAELDVLGQVLLGFGARKCSRCMTADSALKATQEHDFDLLIIDSELADQAGFELIRSIRRAKGRSCFAPILLVTGHASMTNLTKARDCGANFVLAKPIVSRVLFERIAWLARDPRPFVETGTYVGPDRRFRRLDRPAGMAGRRADDLPPQIGEAATPSLPQKDTDATALPQRAAS